MAETGEKKFYKIKEVSEMLNLPTSTLRYWETQFSVLKPRRNDGQIRFYTIEDIETLKLIQFLIKDKGLKISAAQEAIRRNHSGVSRRGRAIEKLHEIRDTLSGISEALKRMR